MEIVDVGVVVGASLLRIYIQLQHSNIMGHSMLVIVYDHVQVYTAYDFFSLV